MLTKKPNMRRVKKVRGEEGYIVLGTIETYRTVSAFSDPN